jgi:hypothetical protein
MSEAETETDIPVLPEPLWSGPASIYELPDGGRLIVYEEGGEDHWVPVPAELVPALEMLRVNPLALKEISESAMGGVARRMIGKMKMPQDHKRPKPKAAANGAG